MTKNERINLVIAVIVIGIGLNLIFHTGTYSYRNHLYVQFVDSPIKEIFGIICVLWGVYLAFIITKGHLK